MPFALLIALNQGRLSSETTICGRELWAVLTWVAVEELRLSCRTEEAPLFCLYLPIMVTELKVLNSNPVIAVFLVLGISGQLYQGPNGPSLRVLLSFRVYTLFMRWLLPDSCQVWALTV